MNKEYIEREDLLQDIKLLAKSQTGYRQQGILGVCETIRMRKAADVAPVVHAYWDTVESERFWLCNLEESLKTGKPTKVKLPICSHCKTEFGTIAFDFKHCPECGAKMDGGNSNE